VSNPDEHGPICRRCYQKLENNKYFDIWTTPEHQDVVFVMWTGSLSRPMYAIKKESLLYNTLKRYVPAFMCRDCLVTLECRRIKEHPLEDLPLLINQKWITEEGTQTYHTRLQTLTPAK
jgi:hypothetical protein